MITLKLYKFNKKLNSTKDPINHSPSAELTINGYFRTPTSIINPVVELANDEESNINFYEYNYAYITNFKRFYFISNFTTNKDVWTMYLKEDVLSTFHDSIINSTQYILRSYSLYDNSLIDNFYKTKIPDGTPFAQDSKVGSDYVYRVDQKTGDYENLTISQYFHTTIGNGVFVLCILGDNLSGANYFLFDATGFKDFLSGCFNLVPSNMGDFSSATVKNAVYNPMQYITSCRWYPVMPLNADSVSVTTVTVGSQDVDINSGNCYRLNSNFEEQYCIRFTIPDNPYAIGERFYEKLSPYTQYNVYSRLFGNIPVDSTKIFNRNFLYFVWTVDYCSGDTYIKMATSYDMVTQTGNEFFTTTMSTGVEIPMATLTMSIKTALEVTGLHWLDTAISSFSSSDNSYNKDIFHMAADFLDGKIGNKFSDLHLFDTIADTLGASLGQVQSKGAPSSFSSYGEYPKMYAWFFKQTDSDPQRFGRPYFSTASLENLVGFVVCQNSHIDNFLGSNATSFDEPSNPLQSEINNITDLLDSGIFIE